MPSDPNIVEVQCRHTCVIGPAVLGRGGGRISLEEGRGKETRDLCFFFFFAFAYIQTLRVLACARARGVPWRGEGNKADRDARLATAWHSLAVQYGRHRSAEVEHNISGFVHACIHAFFSP